MERMAAWMLWGIAAAWLAAWAKGGEPAAAPACAVVWRDANPSYLGEHNLPVRAAEADNLPRVLRDCPERRGIAADGVTRLIVEVAMAGPGTVAIETVSPEDGRLDPAVEGDDVRRLPARRVGERYCAWALYTAPGEFGAKFAGKGTRSITLRLKCAPQQGECLEQQVAFQLVRPPVVLVHGTYHGPREAWATPPPQEIGDLSMVQHLQQRGFDVFLCDYERSNGNRAGRDSHLYHNQRVVWENPGGIREALQTLRDRGIAVTQADVVGHSMGGTLARAYARGRPLPQPERDALAGEGASWQLEEEEEEANWYLRRDNYHRGDIHRLITLCTPHFGSEIVRLVRLYPECCRRVPAEIGQSPKAKALLQVIDLVHDTRTGAFLDQGPASDALRAIGPTPIPSHAIAGVAKPEDFSQFQELYRWNFLVLYLNLAPELLEAVFCHEQVCQQDDARKLTEFLKSHAHLLHGLALRVASAKLRRTALTIDPQLEAQYTQALALFCEAVFRGQPHDGAVAEASAHGGIALARCRSTLKGVVHGFAPRYPHVQRRISDLLEGPAEDFHAEGFPPAGVPPMSRGTSP